MKEECQFTVGQEVTIVGRGFDHSELDRILTVAKVSKRPAFVELSDGQQWEWSGCRPYCSGRRDRSGAFCNGPSIRATKPEDREAIARRRLVDYLTGVTKGQWRRLSVEVLRSIADAVKVECSHCGKRQTMDNDVIAPHDFPVPCRQVCPGSGKAPRVDGATLGKDVTQ